MMGVLMHKMHTMEETRSFVGKIRIWMRVYFRRPTRGLRCIRKFLKTMSHLGIHGYMAKCRDFQVPIP